MDGSLVARHCWFRFLSSHSSAQLTRPLQEIWKMVHPFAHFSVDIYFFFHHNFYLQRMCLEVFYRALHSDFSGHPWNSIMKFLSSVIAKSGFSKQATTVWPPFTCDYLGLVAVTEEVEPTPCGGSSPHHHLKTTHGQIPISSVTSFLFLLELLFPFHFPHGI